MRINITVFWRMQPVLSFQSQSQSGKFKLGNPKWLDKSVLESWPDSWLKDLRSIIRRHINEFYKEPRYCSFFDETGMIETRIEQL